MQQKPVAVTVLFALAVLLLAPGLASGSETDEIIWDPETRLSFSTAHDYTNPSNQHKVAVDDRGLVHVVWYNAVSYRVIYKRYTPGAGWGDSTMLGTDIAGTHYDRYPSVALDDSGRLHVVWTSGPTSSANAAVYYQIWDSTRTPHGGWNQWSARLSDDSAAKTKTNPGVACTPDGRVHAVWGERTSVAKYAYYVAYVEKIDTLWQAQVNLDTTDYEKFSTAVAASRNGNLHLTWRGNDAANPTYTQIFYKECIGTVWQPRRLITSGLSYNQIEPSIVANPLTDEPHIAWRSLVIANGRIWHTCRSGGVWQPVDTVSERTLTTLQQEPQLVACRDGRVYVFWHGYSAASPSYLQARQAERTPAGVWRLPMDATAGSYHKYNPSVALDTLNELYLVWRDLRAGSANSDVYFRHGFNPAKDVGLVSIVTPVGMYVRGGPMTPSAWVKNLGIADQDSFPVKMTIGASYASTVMVRNLASGDSTLVSFAPWNPSIGVYPVACSTRLAGDRDSTNDVRTALATVADYIERFDNDSARYAPTPVPGWAWGTPASPRPPAHSTPRVWAAPLSGSYINNADWRLVSLGYTALQDTPVVSFWHWYSFETEYDGGNLCYSTNDGASWNLIEPWAQYSAPYYGTIRGLGYEDGYSGVTASWEQAFFRIPVAGGTPVRLRWRLGSDASNNSFYGWMIDDVALLGLRKPDVGIAALVAPVGTTVLDSITPSAWVKNYGSATGAFDVAMSISPGYANTVSVGPLGVGESTKANFARWLPPSPGFYAVKCSTRLAGDHYNANDFQAGTAAVVNFVEHFDESNAGYVPTPPTAAWAWGAPASPPRKPPYSAPNVWGAPLSGNYANNANWQLASVPYAATVDTPVVSFWHWFRYQPPPAPPTPAYDGGNVSFSTDRGATWTVIEPWAERAKPYYTEPIAGLGNERGYTGVDTFWNQAWFRLPVASGRAFWLRWRLGSNASTASYGWMVDDVAGMGVTTSRDAGVARIASPAGLSVLDSITPSAWVKNYGSAALGAFDVRMTIGAVYSSTVPAGPLGVGESASVTFAKWLPPAAGFYPVRCSTRLTGDNYQANDAATGEAVIADFTENFDANDGGFIADPPTAAWAWGAPASPPRKPPRSLPNVWGAPLSGNYANNANWKLTSVNYVATADTPVVSFWHWFRYQPPPSPPTPAYDGGNVSYSTDNGATWTVVTPWLDRSKPYYTEPIAGLGNEYGYTGIDTFWNQAWFRVPVAQGTSFQLRWRLGSNASTASYGWMVEDLSGIGMRRPVDVGATQIVAPVGTVVSGQVVAPRARVRNFGGGTRTFDVRFDIAGYSDTKTVTDLASGEEREVTFADWTASPLGTLAVRCSTRLAGDDFPGNDKVSGSVFVRLTDVQPTVIVAPVGTVDSGAVIPPRVRVRNNGNQAETFPVLVTIGTYSNTQSVSSLGAGEEREITFANWTATARGANIVRCTTRLAGDQVPGNDRIDSTVTVVVRDVGVTVITAPVGTVSPGAVIAPSCSVYNYGSIAATYRVRMKIGAGYDTTASVTAHAPGTAALAVFPNWTAGPLGVLAVKCSTELAADMKPANDRREGTVAVGRYDAGVAAILVPADSVDSGAVVTPQVRVRNFGPDSASFQVRFLIHQSQAVAALRPRAPLEGRDADHATPDPRLADQVYEDSLVLGLRGQDSTEVSFRPWTAGPVGSFRLESFTRLNGDVNPANDTARGSVRVVRAVRDVGAHAILAPVGTVDSGAAVIPAALVHNFGNRQETFRALLAIGTVYADTQELTLAAGASDTVEFGTWTAFPVGWHVVRCTTLLAGDVNPANDLALDSVQVVSVPGVEEPAGLPTAFAVSRVMPNPLCGSGVIRLALPKPERVSVRVYDASGRLAMVAAAGAMEAGFHRLTIDGAALAEGAYLVRLQAGEHRATEKLIVQH